MVRRDARRAIGAAGARLAGIASGAHTLILAPTGTGKTLAAFLWELNALIVEGSEAPLPNAVQLLYISPLKALNNDIQRNLERPLAELKRAFEAEGEAVPGDPRRGAHRRHAAARAARMLRKSPHILITTPSRCTSCSRALRGRGMFSASRAVIVDEIHAVAGTKRGAHLALTLERLEIAGGGEGPQRIGLSATQRPLEEIARFLGGQPIGAKSSDRSIVDCGLVKKMELACVSPVPDLARRGRQRLAVGRAARARGDPRGAHDARLREQPRAGGADRGARERARRRGARAAVSRLALARAAAVLEERLKAGELRALVTTSSLELGIDIGSVDLVIQLQCPKRVVGGAPARRPRRPHARRREPRRVRPDVPRRRDGDRRDRRGDARGRRRADARGAERARRARAGHRRRCVASTIGTCDALFDLVRASYPYHALTRAAFDEMLAMLSGKYPSDVAAELEARITWDRVSGSR